LKSEYKLLKENNKRLNKKNPKIKADFVLLATPPRKKSPKECLE
jgi:hypothetical protein